MEGMEGSPPSPAHPQPWSLMRPHSCPRLPRCLEVSHEWAPLLLATGVAARGPRGHLHRPSLATTAGSGPLGVRTSLYPGETAARGNWKAMKPPGEIHTSWLGIVSYYRIRGPCYTEAPCRERRGCPGVSTTAPDAHQRR